MYSALVLELQEKMLEYSHQSRLQTGELHELLRKLLQTCTCTMIKDGGRIPPLVAHAVDTRRLFLFLAMPGYEASVQNTSWVGKHH